MSDSTRHPHAADPSESGDQPSSHSPSLPKSPDSGFSAEDRRLLDEVLRDAQALLDEYPQESTLDSADQPVDPSVSASMGDVVEPESSSAGFDLTPRNAETLVTQVDGLIDDLARLVDGADGSGAAAVPVGLDLTAVRAAGTDAGIETEDAGSGPDTEGPQVDLFAVSSDSIEVDAPASETPVTPSVDESDSESNRRIEPAASSEHSTDVLPADAIQPDPTPVTESSSITAEDDEAARRIEDLLANRLAEESDFDEATGEGTSTMVDSSHADPEPSGAALVAADDAAAARAEQAAIDALDATAETTSDSTAEIDGAVASGTTAESTAAPEEPVTEAITESSSVASAEDVASVAESEAASSSSTPASPATETTTRTGSESESGTVTAVDPEVDSVPTPATASAEARGNLLVRIGAAPYRFVPDRLRRHVTPVALSLAAWVPLAWGYALFGPEPAPPPAEVLHAGFDVPGAAVVEPEPAATSPASSIEGGPEATVGTPDSN